MSRRTSALLLASWLLVPGLSRADDDLDAEKIAKIRREEQAAQEKVDKAHGNKKASEMSNEERRQVIEEKSSASNSVLEKNGVTAKDYARHTARMGPEGNKAVAAAEARQEAEEKAKQEAAKKQQAEPREIAIQQGISDKNPVELESDPNAGPVIEHGNGEEEQPTVAAAEKDSKKERSEKRPAKEHKKKKSRHDSGDDN